MPTKIQKYLSCGLSLCLLTSSALSASTLNLGGRKDKVLTPQVRGSVLAAADRYLSRADDGAFDSSLAALSNPYTFEQRPEQLPEPERVVETVQPVQPKVKLVYDEEAVLKLVAKNFVKQIRGTMGMGGRYYIQLQKGASCRPVLSFR